MNTWLPLRQLMVLLSAMHNATATTLSDPTQPSGTPSADLRDNATGGWKLSATRITPAKRVAVINGQQVAEGDLIGTARVLPTSTGPTLYF